MTRTWLAGELLGCTRTGYRLFVSLYVEDDDDDEVDLDCRYAHPGHQATEWDDFAWLEARLKSSNSWHDRRQ